MSHSALFVFLVALPVIVLANGGDYCQGRVSRGRFGGACFNTGKELIRAGRDRCDAIIEYGCPNPEKTHCCVQCYRQNKLCQRKYSHSVSRNLNFNTPNVVSPCCNDELVMGPQLRPGSTCSCCKHCRRKPGRCRRHGSRCITEYDPVYNVPWCEAQGGKVKRRLCIGYGCWCCKIPKQT